MAAITPTQQTALIVDEFINYAIAHLLTVGGNITGTAVYPGVPATPGPIVLPWVGYVVPPSIADIPLYGLNQAQQNDEIQQTEEQRKQSIQDQKDFDALRENRREDSFTPPTESESVEDDYGSVDDLTNSNRTISGTPFVDSRNRTFFPSGGGSGGRGGVGGGARNPGASPQTNFIASNVEARKAAEDYLGRKMSDTEFANLISLVNAESSSNQTERAWVMAVILNRTRTGYTPAGNKNSRFKFDTVTDIISQPSQFQPVTGTRANPGPNSTFRNGPGDKAAKSIYGAATNILKDVPKNYVNFTANNPAAYGPGTNINYLTKLRGNKDSVVLGGTIFSPKF
jgi:hypothetical protein